MSLQTLKKIPDEVLAKEFRRPLQANVAFKGGGKELHERIVQTIFLASTDQFRILTMRLSSPIAKKTAGHTSKRKLWLPTQDWVHSYRSRIVSVVVVFLSKETLRSKQVHKMFDFLKRDKKTKSNVGVSRCLLVDLDSPVAGPMTIDNRENNRGQSTPNMQALANLAADIKKQYRVDLREHIYGLAQKNFQASVAWLRQAIVDQSSEYYRTLASNQLRASRSAFKKIENARSLVRKHFQSGIFYEFVNPEKSISAYNSAFNYLKDFVAHTSATVDDKDDLMRAAAVINFKLCYLHDQQEQRDLAYLQFKKFLDHFKSLGTSALHWEWISNQHYVMGSLFSAKSSVVWSEVPLNASFYYMEAALYLKRARKTMTYSSGSRTMMSLADYEERIKKLLKNAVSEIPQGHKRFKLALVSYIVEECVNLGENQTAVDLCARIASSRTYIGERWWPLRRVLDEAAFQAAARLGNLDIAINHALCFLHPRAVAPGKERKKMAQNLVTLVNQPRLYSPNLCPLSDALHWNCPPDLSGLIQLRFAFDSDMIPCGSRFRGFLTITSRFPISISFVQLALSFNDPKFNKEVNDKAKLLLTPDNPTNFTFEWTAPIQSGRVLVCEDIQLQLGHMPSAVLFFADVDKYGEPQTKFVAAKKIEEPINCTVKKIPATEWAAHIMNRFMPKVEDRPETELNSTTQSYVGPANSLLRSKLAQMTDLRHLDLSSTQLTAQKLELLLEALLPCRQLRTLLLNNNPLGANGVVTLAQWIGNGGAQRLRKLSVWGTGLSGETGGAALARLMLEAIQIEELEAGRNDFGDEGAVIASRQLSLSKALTTFSLWSCGLGARGFFALSESLINGSVVKHLDLRDNSLDSVDCFAVAVQLMRASQRICTLQLSGNAAFTTESFRGLADAISDCNFVVTNFGSFDEKPHEIEVLENRNASILSQLQTNEFAMPFKQLHVIPAQLFSAGSHLISLDLSHNELTSIPIELTRLNSLSHLSLAENHISTVPEAVLRLENLKSLDLSSNQIRDIPAELGALPLSTLNIASNKISSIPPEMFNGRAPLCRSARLIDLSFNALSVLCPTLGNCVVLEELFVNNNIISDISPEILSLVGQLKKFTAHYNAFQTLPPGLSLHRNHVTIHDNPLAYMPREVVMRGSNSVWSYLEDLRDGQQQCFRMKLMFVGNGNVGKTTLMKALQGRVKSLSKFKTMITGQGTRKQTEGIDVGDWTPDGKLTFSTWDFAGQEIYYTTHQFFLSQRSLYVIVFNMVEPLEEHNLITWLNSIQLRAPQAPVILVGTHADHKKCTHEHLLEVSSALSSIVKKWSALYRRDQRIKIQATGTDLCYVPVASIRGDGLGELRKKLLEVSYSQSCMKEQLPKIYLNLLQLVRGKREDLREPFVHWDTLRSWGGVSDEDVLRRALLLLHEWGEVVFFDDPALSDLVILDPNWLTQFMATIVNTKSQARGGLLAKSVIPQLWQAYDKKLHSTMSRLLEKFEVWTPLNKQTLLVPCLLEEKRSELAQQFDDSQKDQHIIGRVYLLPFIPHGFFSRLLLRIWSFAAKVDGYWANGAVVFEANAQGLLEIMAQPSDENPFQSRMQILVQGTTEDSSTLLTKLVFVVHAFLQDWYAGMQSNIVTLLPCISCLRQRQTRGRFNLFNADNFLTDYMKSGHEDTVHCPSCDNRIPVEHILPEIVVGIDGRSYAEEVEEHQLLGVGGFAEVYKAKWKGEDVAVKKLTMKEFSVDSFQSFAREVSLMQSLDHGNVVKLHAAFSRPPALVLEFVGMGALDEVLQQMSNERLDWPLILRIALEVAQGMAYLHNHNPLILHRDLKSPNILVASLDLKSENLVKVADLGMSCYNVGKVSGQMIDNPRWVPPETLISKEYIPASDVYSFGIVCNELVTRETPWPDEQWNSNIEEMIKAGQRPTQCEKTIKPFQVIIDNCWAQDHQNRPPFDALVLALLKLSQEYRQ